MLYHKLDISYTSQLSGCTAEVHAAATTVYFIENETISNLAVCLHVLLTLDIKNNKNLVAIAENLSDLQAIAVVNCIAQKVVARLGAEPNQGK